MKFAASQFSTRLHSVNSITDTPGFPSLLRLPLLHRQQQQQRISFFFFFFKSPHIEELM